MLLAPPAPDQIQLSPSQGPFIISGKNLPDWLWFNLYQICAWDQQTKRFILNQATVSQASSHQISKTHIRWAVETANNCALTPCQQAQLARWIDHSQAYSLQIVLSVKNPTDLQPIFKFKKLRQAIVR